MSTTAPESAIPRRSAPVSFWAIARRPRWIAVLILVLAIASAFAALGRWQLERSVAASVVNEIDTETPIALASVAEPGVPVSSEAYARVVTTSGVFDPEGYVVLHGRMQAGEAGYWLVGRLITDNPGSASLAVALGWAATEDAALAATSSDVSPSTEVSPSDAVAVQGRYLPSEESRFEDVLAGHRSALLVAELINLWPDFAGDVYAGYLIADEAPAGLETIEAPPPLPEQQVNLLNLFYAIEWAVFAGFAIYLWWRLVKDEVEKAAEAQANGANVD